MICPKCQKEFIIGSETTVIKDLFTKACFKVTIYKCSCGFEIMYDFERTNVTNERNISETKLTLLLKQAWEEGFIANHRERENAYFNAERSKKETITKLLLS